MWCTNHCHQTGGIQAGNGAVRRCCSFDADIAAAVGAERLREIMAELADRCAAVVQRYGGTVDKFTGDGIMAVFGAPVALEDHAVLSLPTRIGCSRGG